jgi:hypothetical protein
MLVVATVIAATKFVEGAWVVVLLLPLLILLFLAIRRHYLCVECERRAAPPHDSERIRHRLIVPIVALNTATQWALTYARSISPQVVAVHVNLNPKTTASLCARWEQWQAGRSEGEQMQLEVIEPIQHSLICSLLHYFLSTHRKSPDETLTVILPETMKSRGLWQLLDHPRLLLLKIALFFQAEIVATSVKREEQKSSPSFCPQEMHHCVLVPIAGLDWVSLHSLMYARSISSYVTAIHIAMDLHDIEVIRAQWEKTQRQVADTKDVHLVVIESPYRSLLHPLLAYIEVVQELYPGAIFTVILPEFVVDHWWEHFLHNQTALQVKVALLAQPNIAVTGIPQRLQRRGGPFG